MVSAIVRNRVGKGFLSKDKGMIKNSTAKRPWSKLFSRAYITSHCIENAIPTKPMIKHKKRFLWLKITNLHTILIQHLHFYKEKMLLWVPPSLKWKPGYRNTPTEYHEAQDMTCNFHDWSDTSIRGWAEDQVSCAMEGDIFGGWTPCTEWYVGPKRPLFLSRSSSTTKNE